MDYFESKIRQGYQAREEAEDIRAEEWETTIGDLRYAVELWGYEKLINWLEAERIATAPPAPRQRPTTFQGISID